MKKLRNIFRFKRRVTGRRMTIKAAAANPHRVRMAKRFLARNKHKIAAAKRDENARSLLRESVRAAKIIAKSMKMEASLS